MRVSTFCLTFEVGDTLALLNCVLLSFTFYDREEVFFVLLHSYSREKRNHGLLKKIFLKLWIT